MWCSSKTIFSNLIYCLNLTFSDYVGIILAKLPIQLWPLNFSDLLAHSETSTGSAFPQVLKVCVQKFHFPKISLEFSTVVFQRAFCGMKIIISSKIVISKFEECKSFSHFLTLHRLSCES